MPITNYGLMKVGSFLHGDSVTLPTHICFGTGSNNFDAKFWF